MTMILEIVASSTLGLATVGAFGWFCCDEKTRDSVCSLGSRSGKKKPTKNVEEESDEKEEGPDWERAPLARPEQPATPSTMLRRSHVAYGYDGDQLDPHGVSGSGGSMNGNGSDGSNGNGNAGSGSDEYGSGPSNGDGSMGSSDQEKSPLRRQESPFPAVQEESEEDAAVTKSWDLVPKGKTTGSTMDTGMSSSQPNYPKAKVSGGSAHSESWPALDD